jgi:nucleoside-diphosphate-sugar epimerase
MQNGEKVLLAGASGVLGRHLTAALTAARYEVIGLGRGAGNGVSADLCDREGLLRAVEGVHADVVIHAATALRKLPVRYRDMAATNALRVVGTANLLVAAREIGARRFVAETMVFGYGFGDFDPGELTEDDPYGPAACTAQLAAIVSAMRTKEELTFTAEGIEGVAATVAAVRHGQAGQGVQRGR